MAEKAAGLDDDTGGGEEERGPGGVRDGGDEDLAGEDGRLGGAVGAEDDARAAPCLTGAHADALERGRAARVGGLAGRGLDGTLEDDGQLVVVEHLVPGAALDDDVLYLGGGEAAVKRFGELCEAQEPDILGVVELATLGEALADLEDGLPVGPAEPGPTGLGGLALPVHDLNQAEEAVELGALVLGKGRVDLGFEGDALGGGATFAQVRAVLLIQGEVGLEAAENELDLRSGVDPLSRDQERRSVPHF